MATRKSTPRKGVPTRKPARTAPTVADASASSDADETNAPRATFVFQGTVLALGSTTLAEVEAAHDTVIVRVDEIHQGPPLTQDYLGQPVTVRLPQGQVVEPAEAYLFHTVGWIFGAGVAVSALAVEPAHEEAVGTLQSRLAAEPQRELRERAARADLVVKGQVTQVREVARESRLPISEHDPIWQDAVVEVHDARQTTQGRAAPKEVVVRFAASKDVRWAQAPKFRVGHRGLWLLGNTSAPVAAARSAMALTGGHYLCVEPEDYYPEEQAPTAFAAMSNQGGGGA